MKTCNQLGKVLGDNVGRLRAEQDLTVTQLSRMSGISRPTLYKIENGLSDVPISFAERLADVLCVEAYTLFVPRQK